jgi:hypothetical protein
MNIQKLAENALSKIQDMVDLPKTGVVAGGSLANLIWEEVSGNKDVINDVDIFAFTHIMTLEEMEEMRKVQYSKNFYDKKDVEFLEHYNGMRIRSKTADFFKITKVSRDGLLNTIEICGTKNDPLIIIDSFDINCTQIGYSIDQDKFYWTSEFEEFINTGQLKVSNLMSPIHTAIRIVKKEDELNAKLDDLELEMCQYSVHHHLSDINRRYFTDKYFGVFKQYKDKLLKYFRIRPDKQMTDFMLSCKSGPDKDDIMLYILECNTGGVSFDEIDQGDSGDSGKDMSDIFDIDQGWGTERYMRSFRDLSVRTGGQLMDYVRRYNDVDPKLFSKLKFLVNGDNYFDKTLNDDDLEFMSKIIDYAPAIIPKLMDMKLSEQINSIRKLTRLYDFNRRIGLCVMEHPKFGFEDMDNYTTDDYLLFELGKRKEIAKNSNAKEIRIFGSSGTKTELDKIIDEIGF